MNIGYIILYVSIIVWIGAAIRQWGERFSIFFLLLALEDPVSLLFSDVYGFTSIDTYIYFDLMRFLSLFKKDEIINNRYIFGLAFGFTLMMHFLTSGTMHNVLINAVIHFAIFLKLLEIFVKEISFGKVINIFLMILIFYQLNTVTKIVNTLTSFANSVFFDDSLYYFYVSSAFQILIGVFFCIFTEKNRKLTIHLN